MDVLRAPRRARASTPWRRALALCVGMSSMACGSDCTGPPAAPCHAVRTCITMTCGDKLAQGRSSDTWTQCVEWCRTSRGLARGHDAHCAERIGVLCLRDWYGEPCVRARDRCETGAFLPDDLGGC